MIKTIISILKAKGSHGVHLEMNAHNKRALKFYLKLGFEVLDYSNESLNGDVLILGRVLQTEIINNYYYYYLQFMIIFLFEK